MNPDTLESRERPPRARIRKRRWTIPWIWLVPVAAALVAGYQVYQRTHEFGSTINIRFTDVTGLKSRQTSIQYRGADIGQVTSIVLSKDQQYAVVRAKLQRQASFVARQRSSFWIVRPQLGMGNITGLGTLISGPHIAVSPGGGPATTEFIGVEHSPTILDPEGLNVVLLAPHCGSLRTGVPVYYRGVEVGAVQDTLLSTNSAAVEIHCVIRQRYAPLVRAESKFWNVSGLDVHLGLFRGADINVESVRTLLIGGIAFATPDAHSGCVEDGIAFRLYDKPEKEWNEWNPQIPIAPASNDTEAELNARRSLRLPEPSAP